MIHWSGSKIFASFFVATAWLLVIWFLCGDLAKCQVRPVVIIATPFIGITTAQNSAPIRNVGQVQHTLKVEFPTAKGTVTPIAVFLQASYDNNAWFPFSANVDTVTSLSGSPSFYAFITAYGVFPYIRVSSAFSTPSGLPMTVRYLGYTIPTPNFVTLLTDRFVF